MEELDVLRQQIRGLMTSMRDHLSTGSCNDFSEYTRCCGVIEGLAMAERELLELQKKLEDV